jgi:hypothetical protein
MWNYQAHVKNKLINFPFGTSMINNVHLYDIQKHEKPHAGTLSTLLVHLQHGHAYIHIEILMTNNFNNEAIK